MDSLRMENVRVFLDEKESGSESSFEIVNISERG